MRTATGGIPIIRTPDKRDFISDKDITESGPWLEKFALRLSDYFVYDPVLCGYVGPSNEAKAKDIPNEPA